MSSIQQYQPRIFDNNNIVRPTAAYNRSYIYTLLKKDLPLTQDIQGTLSQASTFWSTVNNIKYNFWMCAQQDPKDKRELAQIIWLMVSVRRSIPPSQCRPSFLIVWKRVSSPKKFNVSFKYIYFKSAALLNYAQFTSSAQFTKRCHSVMHTLKCHMEDYVMGTGNMTYVSTTMNKVNYSLQRITLWYKENRYRKQVTVTRW